MMIPLLAFLRRDILNELSYKFSFALQIAGIFPIVLVFFYISKLFGSAVEGPLAPYGGNYFPFVLIGVAVQNYLSQALGSFTGSIRESQLSGALEAVVVCPVRIPVFLFGSSLYSFFFSSFRIAIYILIGILVSPIGLHWNRLPEAALVLFLSIAAFSSIGILSASFVVLFKRGDPVNWLFSIASWLLGGVYYPVSVLPEPLLELSNLVPTTHSLEALRLLLIKGSDLTAVGPHLLALGAWASIGLGFGVLCFRFALKRAIAKGTLGHY